MSDNTTLQEESQTATVVRARKAIPPGTARKLWVKSGGRCQYTGCNLPLWRDELMHKDMNKAYISHIVAASENGPRGDKFKSKELEMEFDNLMLLCDECHNRIDEVDVKTHTVSMLEGMKKLHEKRIELVTGIMENKRSLVVSYMAKVGSFYPSLKRDKAFDTIIPDSFPFNGYFIEGGTKNSPIDDHEGEYWTTEPLALERWYKSNITAMLDQKNCTHISVFAVAPQPLLIKLGTLITELQPADIFQYFRDPVDSWVWQEDFSDIEVELVPPTSKDGLPVLKLELSAPVAVERIEKLFGGQKLSIWTIGVREPKRDFLRSIYHLNLLKKVFRKAYDEIKSSHPSHAEIHVFPVMPNAAAIEFGRVRMPKADMQLVIYDQNNNLDSFFHTLTIK